MPDKDEDYVAEMQVQLSNNAKKEYLNSLISKTYKILHLIEEEKDTHYSPKHFIYGQILEVNAANVLFQGKLVNIIVKLRVIYDTYETSDIKESRKQIFEIKKIINNLIKSLEV